MTRTTDVLSKLSGMITTWQKFLDEQIDWSGGPVANPETGETGQRPLTDSAGNTRQAFTPAELSRQVRELVIEADNLLEHIANAGENAVLATEAKAQAEAARDKALEYRDSAQGHANTAGSKATEAAGHASTALSHKNAASASATTATNQATAAGQHKDRAVQAEDAAELAQAEAEEARAQAVAAREVALDAQESAVSAKNSAVAAKTSAENAAGRAANSAAAAEGLEQDYIGYKDAAKASADASASSATQSANQASNAAASAATAKSEAAAAAKSKTDAATQASNAASSASSALASRNSASTSASTATTKANEASVSAEAALVSEEAAAGHEADALAFRNTASQHATTATTKASEASASATLAGNNASTAISKANQATEAAESAEASEAIAVSSAATASDKAEIAVNAESVATAKAEEASVSASSALSSKSAAASSASTASSKATEASTHASTANAAKTAAIGAQQVAENARDEAVAAKDRVEDLVAVASGGLADFGAWDASTGVYPPKPELNGSILSAFWIVTKGGTVSGVEFGVGDKLIFSAAMDDYFKVDNTESVTSVNGKKGAVTITAADVGAVRASDAWRLQALRFGSSAATTDLNDIRLVGWYRSDSAGNKFLNLPSGVSGAFTLLVESIAPGGEGNVGYCRQTLKDHATTREWTRVDTGWDTEKWGGWALSHNSSNLPSPDALGALAKSGGSMTGDIKMMDGAKVWGVPLAPNLIQNAYMNRVNEDGTPWGFSADPDVRLEAVSAFTKAFEGPYWSTAVAEDKVLGETITDDPEQATLAMPYWFSNYNKGPRINRGGLEDGWGALADGHILKVTGTGFVDTGKHRAVKFTCDRNQMGAQWLCSMYVKVTKGKGFSYGSDAGYANNQPHFISKATIDSHPQGWMRVVGIVETSHITQLGSRVFNVAFTPDENGEFEGYVALPYLANVDWQEEAHDSWAPSVNDSLHRDGLTLDSIAERVIVQGTLEAEHIENANGGNMLRVGSNGYDTVVGNTYGATYLDAAGGVVYVRPSPDNDDRKLVYHEGYKPSAAELGALPSAGGTLSGNVTASGNSFELRNQAPTPARILLTKANGDVSIRAGSNEAGSSGAVYLSSDVETIHVACYKGGSTVIKSPRARDEQESRDDALTRKDYVDETFIKSSFGTSSHADMQGSGLLLCASKVGTGDEIAGYARGLEIGASVHSPDNARMVFGGYGGGNDPQYAFVAAGSTEYNNPNQLRVYPTHLGWGTKKIYHEGYKPTATDVGALPLTGGTLTGNLGCNALYPTNTYPLLRKVEGADGHGIYLGADKRTILGAAGGAVHLRPNGIKTASGELVVETDGHLRGQSMTLAYKLTAPIIGLNGTGAQMEHYNPANQAAITATFNTPYLSYRFGGQTNSDGMELKFYDDPRVQLNLQKASDFKLGVNVTDPSAGYYMHGRRIAYTKSTTDGYLRFNPDNEWEAVFFQDSLVRTEGAISVGDATRLDVQTVKLQKTFGGPWGTDRPAFVEITGANSASINASYVMRYRDTAGNRRFAIDVYEKSGTTKFWSGDSNFTFGYDGTMYLAEERVIIKSNVDRGEIRLKDNANRETNGLIFSNNTLVVGSGSNDIIQLECGTIPQVKNRAGTFRLYHEGFAPTLRDIQDESRSGQNLAEIIAGLQSQIDHLTKRVAELENR